MRTKREQQIFLVVILLAVILAAGLTWVSINFASQEGTTDAFAPLWAGARYVIVQRGNPYNLEGISRYLPHGAPAISRFVYPIYGLVLFAPFGLIPSFVLAKAVWTALMMICLLAVILVSLSLTLWQPSGRILSGFILFALFGYSTIRGVYTGNPALLVAMLVAFGLQLTIKGRSQAAGIVLGLTIIKPTMVALLLPYVFIYAVSKRNGRLITGMFITIALLVGAGFLIYPSWFPRNFTQVVFLYRETFPASITAVISTWFGSNLVLMVLAAAFGLWLVVEWWRSLGKDSRWFLWTAALTLVLTEFIGIPTNTANYVTLLIPLTLSLSILERRSKAAGSSVVLVFLIILLLASWAPFLLVNEGDLLLPEPVSQLFPLPILALILLYWVRYWALSSVRLRVERIEALRNL